MERAVVFCMVISSSVWLLDASCALGVNERGVGSAAQTAIVRKHNDLRLQLAKGSLPGQPRAINMLRMSYDAKLAAAAQKLADTCEFKHDPVTDDGRWMHIGQNLGLSSSSSCTKGADWNGIIQKWIDEHTDYKYPNNPGKNTGHYTQVAWANTNKIGCGYTFFNASSSCRKLYACNYGPGGNMIGEAPYETGSNGCNSLC